MTKHTFVHRALDREDEPNGYLVSDREYFEANRWLCIELLDRIGVGTLVLPNVKVPPTPEHLK